LHELADARNGAEQLAYQTERTLAEHRDKLEEAEAATIEGRVMELRQAIEGTEVAEIRAKTEALQEASRSLADAIYAQASTQAASQTSGNGGPAEDEDVEDADFEVIDEEEATKS
jgi:molecular chaperone DnaK